jgi:acyl-CoA synthetase (AMP-forming)/AMP-acid ligase II
MSRIALRIVDPVTLTDMEDGRVGEVWIRSDRSFKEYWRKPEATQDSYPEGRDAAGGWFRSGDAGYLQDGYLFLSDRIKDMIVSGGENIYPAEVENTLMKHPDVADGAVIGVPDPVWGESVKACVVLRPGATASEADLIHFMRTRIAHFKCPKTVDFLAALPRTESGKLLKRELRAPYWAGHERSIH